MPSTASGYQGHGTHPERRLGRHASAPAAPPSDSVSVKCSARWAVSGANRTDRRRPLVAEVPATILGRSTVGMRPPASATTRIGRPSCSPFGAPRVEIHGRQGPHAGHGPRASALRSSRSSPLSAEGRLQRMERQYLARHDRRAAPRLWILARCSPASGRSSRTAPPARDPLWPLPSPRHLVGRLRHAGVHFDHPCLSCGKQTALGIGPSGRHVRHAEVPRDRNGSPARRAASTASTRSYWGVESAFPSRLGYMPLRIPTSVKAALVTRTRMRTSKPCGSGKVSTASTSDSPDWRAALDQEHDRARHTVRRSGLSFSMP